MSECSILEREREDNSTAIGQSREAPVDLAAFLARSLATQQELTAVERFSKLHDDAEPGDLAVSYQALMPAQPPREGQQYAFDVDLGLCTGCKACVAACHSRNGLDDGETWRDVGLLIGYSDARPTLQHVTTACHHCLDPACLNACPVDAYEKDKTTGIVRHLDDQCFGCQYCTLACPYEVPKYHAGKGIVRKCDLCSNRLAVDEAPACVQGCPNEAIRISVVDVNQVEANSQTGELVPGTVDSSFTRPTTTYRNGGGADASLAPADAGYATPQHAHFPLVAMLVLSQLSVGALFVGALAPLGSATPASRQFNLIACSLAFVAIAIAIAAATLHLGRPQYAFRGMIGIGHSWLSRELAAFGAYLPLAALSAIVAWFAFENETRFGWLATFSQSGALITGFAGIACSVMIYWYTRRPFWRSWRTPVKFFGSTALLGTVTSLAIACYLHWQLGSSGLSLHVLSSLVLGAAVLKLMTEASLFWHWLQPSGSSLSLSASLEFGPLFDVTKRRFAIGVLGGVAGPLLLFVLGETIGPAARFGVSLLMLALCFVGEMFERYLFFRAVVPFKMPGGIPK